MEDLMKIGERISHIRQAFNAREGIDRNLGRCLRQTYRSPPSKWAHRQCNRGCEGMRVKYFEGMAGT